MKIYRWLLVFIVSISALCVVSMAADNSRSYEFEISVNGQDTVSVVPGDVITVTVGLHRTDSDESAPIYALQTELRYNAEFLEIVEGGILTAAGIDTTDISLQGNERALYLSFVSFSGGETWEADTVLGSIQMRILSEKGSDTLFLENNSVSVPDGSDSYEVGSKSLALIATTDCTVVFETNNGEKPTEIVITLGEMIPEPSVPKKKGYDFTGWYRDVALSKPWNFEQDAVTGNMTLYAGWALTETEESGNTVFDGVGWRIDKAIVPAAIILLSAAAGYILIEIFTPCYTVRFDTCGGTDVPEVRVKKGKHVKRPEEPIKGGYEFVAWFKDSKCSVRWRFSEERVWQNTTIYAGWEEDWEE